MMDSEVASDVRGQVWPVAPGASRRLLTQRLKDLDAQSAAIAAERDKIRLALARPEDAKCRGQGA